MIEHYERFSAYDVVPTRRDSRPTFWTASDKGVGINREERLVVEVDGGTHELQKLRDEERDLIPVL